MGHHIKQKINHNRTALERSVTEETNEGFESIFFHSRMRCNSIYFIYFDRHLRQYLYLFVYCVDQFLTSTSELWLRIEPGTSGT